MGILTCMSRSPDFIWVESSVLSESANSNILVWRNTGVPIWWRKASYISNHTTSIPTLVQGNIYFSAIIWLTCRILVNNKKKIAYRWSRSIYLPFIHQILLTMQYERQNWCYWARSKGKSLKQQYHKRIHLFTCFGSLWENAFQKIQNICMVLTKHSQYSKLPWRTI